MFQRQIHGKKSARRGNLMIKTITLLVSILLASNSFAFLTGCTDKNMVEKPHLKVVKTKELPVLKEITSKRLPKADKVFVSKSTRQLFLMKRGVAFKVYKMVLGKNPIGSKLREGDNRTPEGQYKIDWRNSNSKFTLSLHINYPNDRDIDRARDLGYEAGGDIMIHGEPNSMNDYATMLSFADTSTNEQWLRSALYMMDWTAGCVAVRNNDMNEIYKLVKDGTPIWINP